jgi:hypothetical protein
MVVTAIFKLISLIIGGLASFMPSWDPVDFVGITDELTAKAGPLFGFLRWLDWYLPVTEFIQIAGVVLGLYAAAVVYKAVMWLLTKLHVLGG